MFISYIGEGWGRGWEQLNEPIQKISLWRFFWPVPLWEPYMRFPLGVFAPVSQASSRRLCEEDALQEGWPHHPRKWSSYGSGFCCSSPLRAGQAEWIQHLLPDVLQHVPLLAPRLKPSCSTSGFLWPLGLQFTPKVGKQHKNNHRQR